MSQSLLDADTIVDLDIDTDDGNHDLFSHYAEKEAIIESALTGVPLTALCGKKWLPKNNPLKHPVCPECKEIFETLKKE